MTARQGPFRFAVVNDQGFITCTTDQGKRAHHLAVWSSREAADAHAKVMREIPENRGKRYDVVEVLITEVET